VAKHELGLSIPRGEIVNADAVITVHSDGVKVGELRMSRGTIDWHPANHKHRIRLSWEEFDKVMRGTERWIE
jgi:hypothetical protein